MKPFLEQVPLRTDSSFLVREFNVPYFEAPLHFHPVYELTLITASHGKRYIGDHVDDFEPGDLVFLGPGLPHFYRCSDEYYAPKSSLRARAIIIQFEENFLGKDFFSIPESEPLKQFFTNSMRGISFRGETKFEAIRRMKRIRFTQGIEKVAQLLSLLHVLAKSDEFELLSRHDLIGYNPKDTERMNRIYAYVMANFTNHITLEQVAAKAHMSEAAFCRYFKKKTRKTFTSFLKEVRISYATKLLVEDDMSVAEICYKCGYENLSNFNRQFKSITKVNPLTYRQQFKELPTTTTEYLIL